MAKDSDHIKSDLFIISKASIADRILFHPLDNMISVQQKYGGNINDCFRSISSAGYKQFYVGFLGSLISSIPVRVATYSTYFIIRDLMTNKYNYNDIKSSIISASASGIAEASILYPSDLFRTRMILNVKNAIPFYNILQSYGLLSLRLIIENNIGLTGAYIIMKNISKKHDNNIGITWSISFATGVASQFFSAPFDTLKSITMHDAKSGFKNNISSLIKMGLFRGASLKMLRAGLCNAVIFTAVTSLSMKK